MAETYSMNIADADCGMNKQIAVLLKALSMETIDAPRGMWMFTVPFTNCREMGFVVSVNMPNGPNRNYCFYEHRNSDQIILQQWNSSIPICWGVRAEDIPNWESKWDYTKSWGYMEIAEVIGFMHEELESIIALWENKDV